MKRPVAIGFAATVSLAFWGQRACARRITYDDLQVGNATSISGGGAGPDQEVAHRRGRSDHEKDKWKTLCKIDWEAAAEPSMKLLTSIGDAWHKTGGERQKAVGDAIQGLSGTVMALSPLCGSWAPICAAMGFAGTLAGGTIGYFAEVDQSKEEKPLSNEALDKPLSNEALKAALENSFHRVDNGLSEISHAVGLVKFRLEEVVNIMGVHFDEMLSQLDVIKGDVVELRTADMETYFREVRTVFREIQRRIRDALVSNNPTSFEAVREKASHHAPNLQQKRFYPDDVRKYLQLVVDRANLPTAALKAHRAFDARLGLFVTMLLAELLNRGVTGTCVDYIKDFVQEMHAYIKIVKDLELDIWMRLPMQVLMRSSTARTIACEELDLSGIPLRMSAPQWIGLLNEQCAAAKRTFKRINLRHTGIEEDCADSYEEPCSTRICRRYHGHGPSVEVAYGNTQDTISCNYDFGVKSFMGGYNRQGKFNDLWDELGRLKEIGKLNLTFFDMAYEQPEEELARLLRFEEKLNVTHTEMAQPPTGEHFRLLSKSWPHELSTEEAEQASEDFHKFEITLDELVSLQMTVAFRYYPGDGGFAKYRSMMWRLDDSLPAEAFQSEAFQRFQRMLRRLKLT